MPITLRSQVGYSYPLDSHLGLSIYMWCNRNTFNISNFYMCGARKFGQVTMVAPLTNNASVLFSDAVSYDQKFEPVLWQHTDDNLKYERYFYDIYIYIYIYI